MGRGHETEQCSFAVEAPRATGLDDLQAGLVVTVQDSVGHAAVRPEVDHGDGVGAVPVNADDLDQRVGKDPPARVASGLSSSSLKRSMGL